MGGQPDARLREALVALTPRQRAARTDPLTHDRAKTIGAIYGTPGSARRPAPHRPEEDDFLRAQVVEVLKALRDGKEEG